MAFTGLISPPFHWGYFTGVISKVLKINGFHLGYLVISPLFQLKLWYISVKLWLDPAYSWVFPGAQKNPLPGHAPPLSPCQDANGGPTWRFQGMWRYQIYIYIYVYVCVCVFRIWCIVYIYIYVYNYYIYIYVSINIIYIYRWFYIYIMCLYIGT